MAQTVTLPLALGSQGWALITQGFGGSRSHNTDYFYHSLDLTLGGASTFGAKVTALGSGVVVDFREYLKDGAAASTGSSDPSVGTSSIGNFVTIKYDSGLYVTYQHLMQNSVVPQFNDRVSAGQVIASVGNTGLREGTHLHVTYGLAPVDFRTDPADGKAVIVADGSKSLPLPVTFDTATGSIGPGVVSEISFTLSSLTLASDRHNLYLIGSGAINGTGDATDNTVSGNRGNNVLSGLAGNDTIWGGSGDDTLIGGAGDDYLNGGNDIDTVSYTGSSAGVAVNLTSTSRQNTGTATGYDTIVGVENVIGTIYGDTLSGNSYANRLWGSGGNDTLNGMSGDDFLYGEGDRDRIYGGAGKDTLSGGSGNDYFIFKDISESKPGSANRDVIVDFQRGDIIDLSLIDANKWLGGDQSFAFIGNRSFSKKAGELRFENGILAGDIDADGRADFEIQILNITIFDNSFIIG